MNVKAMTKPYTQTKCYWKSKVNVIFVIFVTICNALDTYCFIIQDTYNVLLKDDADYTVDLELKEDDYEMIDQNQLANFKSNQEDKFNEFNKWASNEYNETLKTKRAMVDRNESEAIDNRGIKLVGGAYKFRTTTYPRPITQLARSKREIRTDDEMEYNYRDMVNEYYDDTVNETRSNNIYILSESGLSEHGLIKSLNDLLLKHDNYNCTKSDVNGIGLKAIICLWNDYNTPRQAADDTRTRLWRIIKIWFLIYLAIAVPLWCTRGWCFCCLFCKFFKPQKTIDEARKYVIINPPGIFKTKTGDVHYDATEREIESYEEFEHFIRTL